MTHGVLLLDKPSGLSSNAVLQRVRRLYGWVKAGHTGTLDPLATGLLPICLGEATKFSYYLLDADKTYEAAIHLGFVSSTGDAEGILESCGHPDFSEAKLHQVLASFKGPIEQVPPMHSALKKDGRPLYSYARAGETVTRTSRNVLIKDLQILEHKQDILIVKIHCSKGTYIRVLAEDIGKALGCGGYLLSLRRTTIRDLDLRDAITLEQLDKIDDASRIARLLPLDRLVEALPAVVLSEEAGRRLINGLTVCAVDATVGLVRLYDSTGGFLGVGQSHADGVLISERLVSQSVATAQRLPDAGFRC